MTRPEVGDRLIAYGRFMSKIQAEADAGYLVPCTAGLNWVSDDPEDQLYAAHRCQTCHLIEDCRRYVVAFPEDSGIWAGLNPVEQKRLHRKEAA